MFIKYRNPKRSLYRGIISIILGIVVITVPDLTLSLVIQILGAILIADGVLNIAIRAMSKNQQQKMLPLIPRGIPNLIFGVILFAFPVSMVEFFVFIIGFILIIAGVSQLSSQIAGGFKVGFSWIFFLIGLVAFLSGLFLIIRPFESAENILVLFGIVATLYGIGEIVWFFKLKKFRGKEQNNNQDKIIDADYEEVE